jgi:outer membrane biosynthesis protein TonB
LYKRTKLRLVLFAVLLAFAMSPSFADEQTIELSPEVPYVDVPVEATAPTQITIQTTTGTPNDVGFIDSWIELWQDTTRIAFNDDGAHSGTNVLASYLSLYLDAGFYFIRATSYAYACCNSFPTGTYLLTWDGVTTIQTTPTPTPEPTPTETEIQTPSPEPTIEPTEQLSPTPIATDSSTPTPTQEPQPEPQPETNTNSQQSEPILIQEIPSPTPEIILPQIEVTTPEIVEEIVEEETIETPIVEPELSIEQINEIYIQENTIELAVPTALAAIPGIEQIFAATEAIMNVGSDMTQEQREESQSVVIGAIIVTQIASMASISASQSSSRKFKK